MGSRENFLETLHAQRVLFILRGKDPAWLLETAQQVWRAGARLLEVTLDSTDALSVIAALEGQRPVGCVLGAGTVCQPGQVLEAQAAGASFIVSPIATPELARTARDTGLVSMLGAATPTEIWNAWSWGSDLVKVFPAGSPAGFRRMCTPLAQIPLVAVGGVTPENAREFLDAGCVAVALGGAFFATGGLDVDRAVRDVLGSIAS